MKLIKAASREEWLDIRKKFVSSTETSALFGMNPYLTAYELGAIKRDPTLADDGSLGERPRWGQRLQDSIAQGIADDYNVTIESMDLQYAADPEARLGCSMDYKVVRAQSDEPNPLRDKFAALGEGILEIKNVDGLEYKRKWQDEEAPQHIEIQLQTQLEVTGLPWGAVAALIGGNRVALIVRERDKSVGAVIRRKVEKFWQDFDKGILPSPLMPDDAEMMLALYQYAEPNKVLDAQTDETLQALCEEYLNSRATLNELEKHSKALKARFFERIGDAERVLVEGFTVSAAMRAPSEVKAHVRAGWRDLRVTAKKESAK